MRENRKRQSIDKQIAIESAEVFGVTPLPRIVQIADTLHPTDSHRDSLERAWSATFTGFSAAHAGYANFKLAAGWSVERQVSKPPEVVDRHGRARARIIDRGRVADPVLVLLPRLLTMIEAGDGDTMRVATVDRATGVRIRVSPWLASTDHARLAEHREIQAEWLAEIRPHHAEPFAYW